jgi:hypothetical protein
MRELNWEPVEPFRPEFLHSVNYYDDRLLKLLNVDVRHIDPGSITVTSHVGTDGADAYGLRYDRSGLYRMANYHPLAEADVDQIMAFPLPKADAVIREEPLLARLACPGELACASAADPEGHIENLVDGIQVCQDKGADQQALGFKCWHVHRSIVRGVTLC